jgi:hypothetical protein
MVHLTRGKLCELLGNPKDQVETLQKTGIYQIDCLGCFASYIGQSRRSITTRFNDHHRNIRKHHPELSSIAAHVISHMNDPRSKHDINLDNFSLPKEVRRHLDAFGSYYILKAKKEGKAAEQRRRERKFNFASQPGPMKSNAKQPLNFLISLTRTLSEDGSLASEIN